MYKRQGQGLGALRSLSELNRKIYQVIVRRFLSIFYPAAVYQKYAVEIEVKGEHFFASFKVLKEAGYLKMCIRDRSVGYRRSG